jgi:glycolate oxidase FAD binding subunit
MSTTILRPTSLSEASEALADATASGHRIRIGEDLDTAGLDRLLEHEPGDLTCTIEAGMRLSTLQTTLAPHGQRLSLDPPGDPTIGACVAAALSGPLRHRYGTPRDLVLGVTLVLADGTVVNAGGKVVKNVAGYDLGKLVTGSYGTLAVLTEVVFRLHPLPAARRFLRVASADPVALATLAASVRHSPVVASALEVDLPADGPGSLTVLLEGTPDGVAGRAAVAAGLLPGAEQADSPPATWVGHPWDPAARGAARATAFKVTCRLSGLAELLCAARASPVAVHLRGSAGVGVLHGAIPAGTDPAAAAAAVAGLRATAARLGGSLVVLDAPAAVKAAVDVWGPVPGLDLMRRVKRRFDPEGRLAPGRFVGGI